MSSKHSSLPPPTLTHPSDVSRYHILAVDLGTSGCKTAVVRLDGTVIGFAAKPVAMHVVAEVGTEQNPEDWWQAFLQSAQEVLKQTQVDRQSVVAVVCSCQGEGTIPVDRSGTPLTHAMLWLDMRGRAAVHRLVKGRLPSIAGYDPIKLWRWIRLTGGAPALSGKDPIGHMAFIRESLPGVYEKTYKFLNVLDFMNLRLTGEMVATVDSLLTSWVTDNRDPAHIKMDDRLIAMSRIDRDKFPQLVRCTDQIGTLLPDIADELGLSRRTRVIAGSVDNTASALGSGAIGDGELHLYIGTSSWVGAHVPYQKTDVFRQIASLPCALPDRYLMMAMQSAAGSNLAFLKDNLLFPQDELTTRPANADIFQVLGRMAAKTPAGSRGLLYLPWLMGERTPVDDPNLRATLMNLSLEHTRADIFRAIMEGVALNTRWMMGSVRKFLKQQPNEMTVVGGGAQSGLWCQILADTLDMVIHQPEQPLQANVRGAAFIAGVGINAIDFSDIQTHVSRQASFEPNPQNRGIYQQRYQEFLAAYRALRPVYKTRAKRAGL
ncbi:xylulokinase [Gynuella sp.]|uniref:xylulokinase n=1 Tax=Gynuella sp. TaxID=2969146 RepID=UPI003D09DB8B